MSESVFKFKQFQIRQNSRVMKIGTDGVLLGAFADFSKAVSILDIGTGTGLIALMAAQKNPKAEIIALEKQKQAFLSAQNNIDNSPFARNITAIHADFVRYAERCADKFSHAVCNPPFYRNALLPSSEILKSAKHENSLPFDELVSGVRKILHAQGLFSIIIPAKEAESFRQMCFKEGMHLQRQINVLPTPHKSPNRVLLSFGFEKKTVIPENLVTESGGRHIYSPEYKALTKDFYLNF